MKLSILICTIEKRSHYFDRLRNIIEPQIIPDQVEVLFYKDSGQHTIGYKRNKLLQEATGDYVCFVDDDDRIVPDYVKLLLEGIEKDVDCCSLIGEIRFNGKNPQKFIHSIDYKEYFEKNKVYYRPPNHLNCIRASIAKQFVFPELNRNEDTNWAMQIANAGVLKTEHKIDKVIYYYDYIIRK